MTLGRTLWVGRSRAMPANAQVFRSINEAAAVAMPGDHIVIAGGIYRERVNPLRGGEPGLPITYRAAPGEKVCVRGSDLMETVWSSVPGHSTINCLPLAALRSGAEAYQGVCDPLTYGDFNPFVTQYDRCAVARPLEASLAELRKRVAAFRLKITDSDGSGTELVNWEEKLAVFEQELEQRAHPEDPRLFTTLGQIFVQGLPLQEVERVSDLAAVPGTWLVSPEGTELWVHFPERPGDAILRAVEVSVRHTLFSPLQRGLGYLTLEDLTFEHGANYFPSWGEGRWGQAGLVSTRGGHHWTIRRCVIRHAKAIGLDCGSEGGREQGEGGPVLSKPAHQALLKTTAGDHLIEHNDFSDNGLCGVCGIGHHRTRLLYNRIERNNSLGLSAPWWEFAGVKFHFCPDVRIEGNIIRDNEAHGIWLDNQFKGARVTRNFIVNNLWSGINLEFGRGPCLVDNNVIALTRQGEGIYGHDVAEMTIAHNLLYANSNFGIWLAYCTSRVPLEDACSDHRILNNMILGNKMGAVALPLEWAGARNNRSDANLLMGSGQTLDEGSGPFPPFFQINNKAHCAQIEELCPGPEVQSAENITRNLIARMDAAGVPEELRPNPAIWSRHFLLTHEVWSAVTGNDLMSRSCRAVRDGLQSRSPAFTFTFDGTEETVACEPVEGVDVDYHGHPLGGHPLPGPFQRLSRGEQKIVLLPRRLGVGSIPP
ncbi:MAG: right-handed parallel beta-helix repeat-containing protein [Kiritimatiellia bacterium]